MFTICNTCQDRIALLPSKSFLKVIPPAAVAEHISVPSSILSKLAQLNSQTFDCLGASDRSGDISSVSIRSSDYINTASSASYRAQLIA